MTRLKTAVEALIVLDESLPMAGLVLVHERTVYGVQLHYPANKLAHALCDLTGSKTFTHRMVEEIKRMGLSVMTTGDAPRSL